MKIIDKLMLKSYLGPMILTFFIVMFVMVIQLMWRYAEDLVGKGLGVDVISELVLYASMTIFPMALPLATLLAAIMTLGNLGENYELLAMKSAGLSLPRILRPLMILVVMIAIGSYFIADRVVPYAYDKMFTLIFDINQQKQTIEFRDGIFFNGLPDISIRVGRQDPQTKLLNEVLIYDNRARNGKMLITTADSGYISMSDDRRFLLITLYNGQTYEESRTEREWFDANELNHYIFDVQNMIVSIEGFDFTRSEDGLFAHNAQTKSARDLSLGIDSLTVLTETATDQAFGPLLRSFFFPGDTTIIFPQTDSMRILRASRVPLYAPDSIPAMDDLHKRGIFINAANMAFNAKNSYMGNEDYSKDSLIQLYRYKVEWHKKLYLPVSILIFFLIGAPLGAIIRRGGLGMPVVVSVSFYVIYYIINITGEKMAKEGTMSSFGGAWLATLIIFPIGILLTFIATRDSNLLSADWYFEKIKKVKEYLYTKYGRK